MTTKKRRAAHASAKDDPVVTEAFVRLCAKITQISYALRQLEAFKSDQSKSQLALDLEWINTSIALPERDDFQHEFMNHVQNQFDKLQVVEHHVTAMKHLARHMEDGYQVASSNARAVVLASISMQHFLSASLTPADRVTRFAADLLEQAKYVGRIRGAMEGWALPIDDDDIGDGRERVAEHLTNAGFSMVRGKSQRGRPGFINAVKYGQVTARPGWNVTSAATTSFSSRSQFAWFLTSGAAHIEPWAVNNFNEGTVDFYGTMANAALVPSFITIAVQITEYLKLDANELVADIERAGERFIELSMPSVKRRFDELPEDDPRRNMLINPKEQEELFRQLLKTIPGLE